VFEQLRQRNVHRVALAYLAGVWLLIQIVDTLTPDILPAGVFRVTVIAAAIGFIPAVVLAWIFEWTPEGLKRERAAPAGAPPPDSRWLDRGIIVTLVVAVAYFAIDKFLLDPVRDEEEIEAATAVAVDEALAGRLLEKYADRSVIVLPFLNLSTDPGQEFFADGIAEELLNLLAKIDELRVISRSTSWTFKGKNIDVDEIRDRLDVSHILEGSVRKAGDRVRVTAQLIDAHTNRHLWSESYDRALGDIFAIQDDIAARVVGQLRLELTDGPPTSEQISPRAYELYLEGHYLTQTVDTPDAYERAVELLSAAVEIEPAYVPALWVLGRAMVNHFEINGTIETEAVRRRLRELRDRIVDLAPDSSYANFWLYYDARQAGDIEAAANYLERAVADHGSSHVHFAQAGAARLLLTLGRFDEAAALARYTVDRDPACSPCVLTLAEVARRAGHHREAAEALEDLLQWRDVGGTVHWNIGVSWLVAGQPAKALEHFDKDEVGPGRVLGRVMALHDLGRLDEFDAEFAKLGADPETHPEGIARIAAWTGQNELAFEYLEQAIDRDGPEIVAAIKRGSDLYEPITSDPRWQAMLDRYDTASEDLSHIRFNPKLPDEVVAALAATE
jgi:adenylate cyclase